MALPDGINLPSFAEHINRSDAFTGDDATEAELILQSAVEVVESICGALGPREVTQVLHRGQTALTHSPVLSLVSATAAGQDWDVSTATVSADGVVTFPSAPWVDLTVTYRVGREPIPASLILAAYIIGSHLWETQRGRSARPGLLGQGQFEDPTQTPMGFAVPNRALQLMFPHRRMVLA